jgi:hypothetical protein
MTSAWLPPATVRIQRASVQARIAKSCRLAHRLDHVREVNVWKTKAAIKKTPTMAINSAERGDDDRRRGGLIDGSRSIAMKYRRIAASAALVALVSAASANAKPVAITADTNLRAAPGTASEVVALIPRGTTVEVGACSNGWCKVSLNGKDGFATAGNLGMAKPSRPRGPMVAAAEIEEVGPPLYGPAPAYVVGPPVYYGYGYGPYIGVYGGWGFGHGWRRHW